MKVTHITAGLLWLALTSASTIAAVPVGDTQGSVSAVRSVPVSNGINAFEVHFSSITSDRWGCLQAGGKLVISESGYGVTPDSFKRMFAIALSAQMTGKELAFDSAGNNPCANVNTAWIVG